MTPKVLTRASTALQGGRAWQNRNFSNIAIPICYYSAIKLVYTDPRLIYIDLYLSPSLLIPSLTIRLIVGSNISTSTAFSILIPTVQYNNLLDIPQDTFNLYSNPVLFQLFILVPGPPLRRISLRRWRALSRSSLFYPGLIRLNYI